MWRKARIPPREIGEFDTKCEFFFALSRSGVIEAPLELLARMALCAGVVELVDTPDLGSGGESRGGT